MALNFPTTPQLNDTYTEGNSTWTWDGVAWNITFSTSQSQSNSFGAVSVTGQAGVVADVPQDVLNLEAGTGITITTNSATDTVRISSQPIISTVFNVAADDSTQVPISLGETVQFLGGAGIETETDTEGNITISNTFAESTTFDNLTDATLAGLSIDKVYEAAIATLRVDNTGTTAYTFPSHYTGSNPTIFALAGTTIAFDLTDISGLPFEVQNSSGQAYNIGLVHVDTDGTVSTGSAAQGKSSGTLYWRINESVSGTFRYQCSTQVPMVGAITVKRLSVI
jgi:hypothetical protein